jgi:hypothetical protein
LLLGGLNIGASRFSPGRIARKIFIAGIAVVALLAIFTLFGSIELENEVVNSWTVFGQQGILIVK